MFCGRYNYGMHGGAIDPLVTGGPRLVGKMAVADILAVRRIC